MRNAELLSILKNGQEQEIMKTLASDAQIDPQVHCNPVNQPQIEKWKRIRVHTPQEPMTDSVPWMVNLCSGGAASISPAKPSSCIHSTLTVGKRPRRGRQGWRWRRCGRLDTAAWLAGDGGTAGDWRRRRGWLETVAPRETGDAGAAGDWRRAG
jgi:hypothetical protein